MSSSTATTTFAEATAITQLSSHTYSANFVEDWLIGTVPHGGYVTCVFLQVAAAHFKGTLAAQNQPHTITLHLEFLRRTEAGPALFTVQDTKLGRQASVIHISLTQGANNREEVVGYITNSNMHTEEGVSLPTDYTITPPPLPVNLSLLKEDKDELWARQAGLPFDEFRKATTKTQFHFPRQGFPKRNVVDEWVRLTTGEKWTNATLGYICDMWPMPVEAYLRESNAPDPLSKRLPKSSAAAKNWYPTLLLNLDIKKALPEEGVEWLFVRVEAKKIKNGRLDLEVILTDETGDIVALSHHVSLVVSADRNWSERSHNASKI